MTATLLTLWPNWLTTIGVIHRRHVQMRSQCRRCGALMRLDPADLLSRHGPAWSPIDHQERCRMVGCDGAAFYLAARRLGTDWRVLLADPVLREGLDALPEPVIARPVTRAGA